MTLDDHKQRIVSRRDAVKRELAELHKVETSLRVLTAAHEQTKKNLAYLQMQLANAETCLIETVVDAPEPPR